MYTVKPNIVTFHPLAICCLLALLTGIAGCNTPHCITCNAKEGSIKGVEYFLARGVDINTTECNGITPFYAAVEGNADINMLKFLVDKGANVNVKDNIDWTPLHTAAVRSKIDVVQFLIEKGVDVNVKNSLGRTPLHEAAGSDKPNIDVFMCLIASGADVNTKDNEGRTPLHDAVMFNHKIVKYLIDQGADVNAKDNDGRKPAHNAEQYSSLPGYPEALKYLVEKRVEVDAETE